MIFGPASLQKMILSRVVLLLTLVASIHGLTLPKDGDDLAILTGDRREHRRNHPAEAPPPTTTTTPKPYADCVEIGAAYSGGDNNNPPLSPVSITECFQVCYDDDNCLYYTYYEASKTCKQGGFSGAIKSSDPAAVSGYWKCDPYNGGPTA